MSFLDPYSAGLGPAGYSPLQANSVYQAPRFAVAMKFDGASGDWVLDENGEFEIVHPVDQGVALALCVKRGDIKASPKTGNTLFRVQLGARDLRGQVEDAVRTASPLDSYLADGSVELLKIEYEERPKGGLVVAVTYRNLASGTVARATTP